MWSLEVKGTRYTFDSLGIRVITVEGTGMPNVLNVVQEHAYTDGSSFQRNRVPSRYMQITGQLYGISLADLHSKRATISELLAYEINLIYSGGKEEVYIPVRYESGFNFNNTPHWFQDIFTLRFLCTYPFFRSTTETQQTYTPTRINTGFSTDPFYLLVYYEDTVTHITSIKSEVTSILTTTTGDVYVGSTDTVTNTNYLVKIDAATGTETVISGLNDTVWTIVEGIEGDIFIGGDFTTPANYIAKINGTSAIAVPGIQVPPLNSLSVRGIALYEVPELNRLWILVVGVPNTGNNIYYLTSSTAFTSGTVISNNPIKSLVFNKYSADVTKDINVIIAGEFDYVYSLALTSIPTFTVDTTIVSNLGDLKLNSGTANIIKLKYIGDNLYACGTFDTADGVPSSGVAYFNGAYWTSPFVNTGIEKVDNVLPYNGGLYITTYDTSTKFVVQNYVQKDNMLYKNGNKHSPLDIVLNNSLPSYGEYIDNTKGAYYPGLYVGLNFDGGELYEFSIFYTGGKPTLPKIKLLFNRIYFLYNITTNKTLYFNKYYPLLNVTVDCFERKFYNAQGDEILDGILPGSDFEDFNLVPGENKFVVLEGTQLASWLNFTFTNEYWGFDT